MQTGKQTETERKLSTVQTKFEVEHRQRRKVFKLTAVKTVVWNCLIIPYPASRLSCFL